MTTATQLPTPTAEPVAGPAVETVATQRRGHRRATEPESRGITSAYERRRLRTRAVRVAVNVGLLAVLVIAALGPILWLAKSAVTPTQDTLRAPLALWPNGIDFENLTTAWTELHLDTYFVNTIIIAVGSWLTQMVVATTGGYALSVLRPPGHRILYAAVLATMFVPARGGAARPALPDDPRHPVRARIAHQPVVGRHPSRGSERLQRRGRQAVLRQPASRDHRAARVDGAGDYRLFWSVVLPMSRPVLGVVSVFAILAAWKDFIWPLIVLPDPSMQPLSVRLPAVSGSTELDVFLAALLISSAVPIAFFLLFQRAFLGGGLDGALKG